MSREATENDVTLDIIAALDMYEGSIGDDDLVIDEVSERSRDEAQPHTILLELSNGQRFELRVREV